MNLQFLVPKYRFHYTASAKSALLAAKSTRSIPNRTGNENPPNAIKSNCVADASPTDC